MEEGNSATEAAAAAFARLDSTAAGTVTVPDVIEVHPVPDFIALHPVLNVVAVTAVPNVVVAAAEKTDPPKPRRFQFITMFDLVLLRAVSDTKAHLSEYENGETRYEKIVEIFVSSHEDIAKSAAPVLAVSRPQY